jgi:hypothetical protein
MNRRRQSTVPAPRSQAPRPDHEHREGAVWIPAATLNRREEGDQGGR